MASMDLAKHWINDCLNLHEQCPRPESPPLPTRVIDIGAEDGSEEPKLLLSQGHRSRYATLSYCWGGPVWFTLTLANLGDMLQCISWSDLPVTFCEALEVTRALGIRYLWIDALCIIQDSDSDKAIEMAKMDQVYHDSSLTICAANASVSSISFLNIFYPRSMPNPYRLAKINFPVPGGLVGNVFLEEEHRYDPREEPLNKRGWALQERLLSPRVLTFGSFQMYWHCQSEHHCEGGTVRDVWKKGTERLGHNTFRGKPTHEISAEVTQVYDNWLDILEDYTQRQLTFRADLLPALSGIATRFGIVLNDTFCAGLWRNDLQVGLAWNTGADPLTPKPSEYRAPTWSWASVDGEVYWNMRRREVKSEIVMQTKIISCDIQPKFSLAPLGEVKGGTIEIHGLVREFDWDGKVNIEDEDKGGYVASMWPDLIEETLHNESDNDGGEPVVFYMGEDQQRVNSTTRRVSCIPMTDFCSLVLDRQRDGEYVRLGTLKFWTGDDDDDDDVRRENMERFFKGSTERTLVVK
jgi:Heterokaryon incompatibility protein (HET)